MLLTVRGSMTLLLTHALLCSRWRTLSLSSLSWRPTWKKRTKTSRNLTIRSDHFHHRYPGAFRPINSTQTTAWPIDWPRVCSITQSTDQPTTTNRPTNINWPEVPNTRSVHQGKWGCIFVFRVKPVFSLLFKFVRTITTSNLRPSARKCKKKFQLRLNSVYENILNYEHRSSYTSVSAVTIKPLSAKNGSQ